MNLTLRIVLIVASIIVFVFIGLKIRKAQMRIADSVFWLLFALSFLLLAIFPGIAYFFSSLFGIASPSNFVFLYIILVLLLREFGVTLEVAKLREQLTMLIQNQALGIKGDFKGDRTRKRQ